MTLISNAIRKSRHKNAVAVLALVLVMCAPVGVMAQTAQSLSVTPPLFQLAATPGQAWQSVVKVINTNDYPITVYANPVNFAAQGEAGQGRFLPILEEETGGQTLAEWITVTNDPIVIAPEQSTDINFSVTVPEDAAPGGHFAAILIGTRPPEKPQGMAVRTSQIVSSLFLVRVAGDVVEKASIREFSVTQSLTERPQARFELRFQNDGNVHVRPQGDITIYNMWGKKRGTIPINHQSHFGNVLPESIRAFEFSWAGESSLSEIGRHTAVVTLAYGTDDRQSVSQSVSFWVIPVKATLLSLAVLGVLILMVRWAITAYIRRMLRMAGIEPERTVSTAPPRRVRTTAVSDVTIARTQTGDDTSLLSATVDFVQTYWFFFVGIPSAMLLIGGCIWYLAGALTAERSFEATIATGDNEVAINSEELRRTQVPATTTATSTQTFTLDVVNVSGEVGAAAAVANRLEIAQYMVSRVAPDLERVQQATVVVAPPSLMSDAQALSQALGGALVSLSEAEHASSTITVFVGEDYLER